MNRATLSLATALLLAAGLGSALSACGDDDVQFQGGEGGDPTGGATTSTTTSTTATTSTGESCDPGFSAGCCFGDGSCCPCAAHQCDPLSTHESQIVLTNCLCEADVCGAECASACVGLGIDLSCFVCAQKVGADACSAELAQCNGTTTDCSAPADCNGCRGCADADTCYDAWHACWFDSECQAVMLCSGDFSRDALLACLPANPTAEPLLTAYLDCTYCTACTTQCPEDSAGQCAVQ